MRVAGAVRVVVLAMVLGATCVVSSVAHAAWSTPTNLSAAGQNALLPQVAVDAAGNAFAVWRRFDGARWIVQSARLSPFSGRGDGHVR